MGAFFTNVQVRLGGGSLEPLVTALRDAAGDVDEVETDEEADRVVLVLPPDEGGWVAIYDQRTDSQDLDALDALGRLASAACASPALSALVHDSDVLDLRLYDGGQRVDQYNSFPGYFEGRASDAQKAAAKGRPERWADVLAIDADALSEIWAGESLFAEQTLRRTCELLGCDARRASVGYRYASVEPLPEKTVALRFRVRERPAHERQAEGPPRLELHAHFGDQDVPLGVGDELRLGFSARNVGGAGRGLTISTWGGAIEDGLIEIDAFELLVGGVRAGARHERLTPERGRSQAGALVFVDRPEQPIPPGSAAPVGFAPGVDIHAMMRAMAARTVHVNIVGRVVKLGRGSLGMGFIPHDAREEGQVGTQCTLDVGPSMRRPLRFEDRFGGQISHALRPLAGDSRTNALVVFDATRAEAIELVRAWLDDAPTSEVTTAVYRLDPQKRPTTRQGKLDPRLVSKDMRDELSVQLTAVGWSLSFGTGVLPHYEKRRVPCLRVSSADRDVAGAWRSRIDAAAARGQLLQAALYLSDPAGESLDVTAYESACGATHALTTLRDWCERWIRVPGDRGLWLGPQLAARLDDDARAALEPIAAVEPVGSATRIVLADRAHMDDFEGALAALLPSADDRREASMALHASPRSDSEPSA